MILPISEIASILGRECLPRRKDDRYRRHAIVVLLVVAAFITPTGDPFTLAVVFLPVYLLWEFGALLVPAAPKPDARAVTPDSTPS